MIAVIEEALKAPGDIAALVVCVFFVVGLFFLPNRKDRL